MIENTVNPMILKSKSPQHSAEESNLSHLEEKPSGPQNPSKPHSLLFYLLPENVWMPIKRFNRNIANVKSLIEDVETPAFCRPLFTWLDSYFKCTESGSSVGLEILTGVISFFSCMYVLAVIPRQLGNVGFNSTNSLAVIALLCGLGSISSGIISNLPIIIAPSTPITIYYITSLQQYNLTLHQGNMAIVYTGVFFLLMAVISPIGRLFARLIPTYIQISANVGTGLLATLSGAVELGLVVSGKYTILALGTINTEIIIGISSLILIAWAMISHSKVSFLYGLFWGTFWWWTSQNTWPTQWTSVPRISSDSLTSLDSGDAILLVFELFILNLMTCFGLCTALCQLGNLLTKEGMVPNGRYLSIIVGITTIISGAIYGPPFVVSPESAGGIKAGAKTGLSAVVAGILFLIGVFFGPLFSAIPPAGSSPVLIMVGMVLFKNVQTLDFTSKFGMPAFICLILIPFSDSIMGGLVIGWICYLAISILTGHIIGDFRDFCQYYNGDNLNQSGQSQTAEEAAEAAVELPSLELAQARDRPQEIKATSATSQATRNRRASSIQMLGEEMISSNSAADSSPALILVT